MSFRNLSPQRMFEKLALEHVPQHKFDASSKKDFQKWKKKVLPLVMNTLGDFPESVPLNPQLLGEWHHDGLRKQRWLIDVQKHLSATLNINYPADFDPDDKHAAIFCCHGHGPYGKEPVMGNDTSAELKENIVTHGYNYGHVMAQKGFVTYSIDFIGFGERNDNNKPNYLQHNAGRDWCNIYYLHTTMLGMTSLSLHLTHGKAATDFVSSLDGIDDKKIGIMGLSGGGTMSLWMSLFDNRIKATEIICYSDLWAYFGLRDLNYCGMQVAPGLFKLVDLPDVQGLIAPRPLLIDIGAYDECFKIDTALACYRRVEEIYATAEAEDNLMLDLHDGQHSWKGTHSVDFFTKHLKP